jgi:hypothetical protein
VTREEETAWWRVIGSLLAGPLVLLLTPIALPALIVNGYVFRVLWGWFAVPALGARPLSLAAATGLVLLAHHLCHQPNYADVKEKSFTVKLLGALVNPLMTLLLGWLIRWLLGAP